MYGYMGDFKNYFQFKKSYIDNTTFRLHYRVTFGILMVASVFATANNFISGSNISCIVDGVSGGIMNTYCWIQGTFTVPSQLTGRQGHDYPHPGIGPPTSELRGPGTYQEKAGPLSSEELKGDDPNLIRVTEFGDEIRHAWYQWTTFMLALLGLMCYIPHYLWKACEQGKLKMVIQGLDEPSLNEEDTQKDRRATIVNYFTGHLNTHSMYIYRFVFCEFLNLVNIVGQVYFLDRFFGYQFSTYGTDVLRISELPIEERVDPMSKVFPKVTKCTFHQYGPSGTVENKDGLCVLAANIINEKTFVFLWFWYIIVICWTSIHLLLRLASMISPYVRLLLLCNRCRSSNRSDINTVLQKCNYGDWFLLMQMAKHIRPNILHQLMLDLRDKFDRKRALHEDTD